MAFYTYQTIDPRAPSHGKVEVRFQKWLLDYWSKKFSVKIFNLSTVKEVLDSPKRIFEGLRTINPGGWCYVGKPREWFIKDRIQVPFPENLVYCVYLNASLNIYNFRAEPSDEKDKFSPKGWKDRYRSLVWKTTP